MTKEDITTTRVWQVNETMVVAETLEAAVEIYRSKYSYPYNAVETLQMVKYYDNEMALIKKYCAGAQDLPNLVNESSTQGEKTMLKRICDWLRMHAHKYSTDIATNRMCCDLTEAMTTDNDEEA